MAAHAGEKPLPLQTSSVPPPLLEVGMDQKRCEGSSPKRRNAPGLTANGIPQCLNGQRRRGKGVWIGNGPAIPRHSGDVDDRGSSSRSCLRKESRHFLQLPQMVPIRLLRRTRVRAFAGHRFIPHLTPGKGLTTLRDARKVTGLGCGSAAVDFALGLWESGQSCVGANTSAVPRPPGQTDFPVGTPLGRHAIGSSSVNCTALRKRKM